MYKRQFIEYNGMWQVSEFEKMKLPAGWAIEQKITTVDVYKRQKEYLGVENDAQLVMNKNGKPMLVDARKHFNLSHSGKYVVPAIADQEVGIDIELSLIHIST